MADLNVNSIGDASGGTTATVNGFTPTVSNMAGRNRIINGNFDIWQRGTSFTSLTSAEFTADRWNLEASGATIDVSRQEFTLGQTDVPENPKYFLRYAVTTGNDNSRIVQKIEGVSTFAGQTVTLSYWARHSSGILPTGLQARLRHEFGSGGAPSSTVYVAGSNINLTSSWQKFTQVFTVPSVSGKTLGTAGNDYLGVNLMWQIGSETSAYTIDIAQVQLEEGSVATPFEHRQYGQELALCQRYYYTSVLTTAWFIDCYQTASSYCVQAIPFATTMRAAPTVTADMSTNWVTGNLIQNFISVYNSNHASWQIRLSATGRGYAYYNANDGASIKFSAEL